MTQVYALVSRGKSVLAEYTATSGNFPTVTRVLLAKIPPTDGRMSYVYDSHTFHYIVDNQVTYLCMADAQYKRRVSYLFLEELKVQSSSKNDERCVSYCALQSRFLAKYGDRGITAIAFAMNEEFQHEIRRLMVRIASYNSSV